MVKKHGTRKKPHPQSSQADLLRIPAEPESPDAVNENPFPVGDHRHGAWEDATARAKQEWHQVNAKYLKLLKESPQPEGSDETRRLVLDRYAYLVRAKFDIWAKRGIQVVWNDAAVKAFDQWLANYANSWLVSMKDHLPPGTEANWVIGELRLALIGRIEFWKSEARGYVASRRSKRGASLNPRQRKREKDANANPR